MAAKASTTLAHRTVPREERLVSPRFSRLLSYHLDQPTTDGACWWHTPQAKSKDLASAGTTHTRSRLNHLINLTCPWTTLTELSAAPLDCGSLSADVSCTTSPGHANFTALSSARMEGSLSHRNTTLWYPKLSKSLTIIFSTFSQLAKSRLFRGNQLSKNRLGHSIVHHENRTVSCCSTSTSLVRFLAPGNSNPTTWDL